MIYGGDFSSWQGTPDFAGLAGEGLAFAIHKATGEGNYVSPVYAPNLAATWAAGILGGSYDWVEPQRAGVLPGREAAADYLRVLDATGGRRPGHLLGVDFETPEWANGPLGASIEPFMRAYVLRLLEEQPILFYTGPYFLDETGARDWGWLRDPRILFWEAAPGEGMLSDDSGWPTGYPPFGEPTIHQHQWHATSRYVVGEYDRNRCRLAIAELAAYGAPGLTPPAAGGGEVREPPAGKWFSYVNDQGEALTVLNHGGSTKRIIATVIGDVGVTVESATEPGVPLDHTFRDEQSLAWHDRRQDATAEPVAAGGPSKGDTGQ